MQDFFTRIRSRFLQATFCLSALGLAQCVTPQQTQESGIQLGYESFVPARIAVLPCMNWPAPLHFQGQAMSNMQPAEKSKICQSLDDFVISGFKNQPFMRGYSPKAVTKLLQVGKQSELLSKITRLWNVPIEVCEQCINAETAYSLRLAGNAEWRLWLNEFSRSTRFSDALLIPFVTYAYQTTEDDRGLTVAKTALGVQLLLIDTNTAKLIWSGGRSSFATNQSLPDNPKAKAIVPPTLDRVLRQLLVDDIWRAFPGRQFL